MANLLHSANSIEHTTYTSFHSYLPVPLCLLLTMHSLKVVCYGTAVALRRTLCCHQRQWCPLSLCTQDLQVCGKWQCHRGLHFRTTRVACTVNIIKELSFLSVTLLLCVIVGTFTSDNICQAYILSNVHPQLCMWRATDLLCVTGRQTSELPESMQDLMMETTRQYYALFRPSLVQ